VSSSLRHASTLNRSYLAAGVGTIEVHQGFYQGAKRQLPEIQRVVAAHASDGGKRLPVRISYLSYQPLTSASSQH